MTLIFLVIIINVYKIVNFSSLLTLVYYGIFTIIQIGTNGIISFQQPFTHHIPSLFPSELTFISSAYLLAPFWSDVDISLYGSIFYEVHNNSNSLLISQVNRFLSNYTETDFNGTWMLVVQWDEVHQFPGFLTIPVRHRHLHSCASH